MAIRKRSPRKGNAKAAAKLDRAIRWRDLRKYRLRMTQPELAQVVGVHHMTVSKWERGIGEPSPFVAALLERFELTRQRDWYASWSRELQRQGPVGVLTDLLLEAREASSADAEQSSRISKSTSRVHQVGGRAS